MDILKFLGEQGIEVPQEKQEGLKTAFSEHLSKVTAKLETERDTLKESLKTAQDTLKTFEGVNVEELKGKIIQLTDDLKNKDAEYQIKIADMEFNSVLDTAIASSGARNAKYVKAALDIDALKASKNQAEDIKAAIESVKKTDSFLFNDNKPNFRGFQPGASGDIKPGTKVDMSKMSYDELAAYIENNPNAE